MESIIFVVAVAVVIMILAAVNAGHLSDEQARRARLIDEARRQSPNLAPVDAVDALYVKTLRQIKLKRQKGEDTEDLEDDLQWLISERSLLLHRQIERETGFEKKQNTRV